MTAHPRYLETPATSALLRSFEARLLFVSQAQRALYQGPQPAFVLEPGARFDYLREAESCAAVVDASRECLDLMPRVNPPVIEPAMTPKKGYIASK